jgi:3-dehydroquinate synthetase
MLLNYGHTVGHALEAWTGYGTLLHGEAVSVGMQAAALIAQRLDMLDEAAARRQGLLLQTLGLPLSWAAPADEIVRRLSLDKKRAGSRQRWVLADRIGAGHVRDDVPPELAREAIEAVTSA